MFSFVARATIQRFGTNALLPTIAGSNYASLADAHAEVQNSFKTYLASKEKAFNASKEKKLDDELKAWLSADKSTNKHIGPNLKEHMKANNIPLPEDLDPKTVQINSLGDTTLINGIKQLESTINKYRSDEGIRSALQEKGLTEQEINSYFSEAGKKMNVRLVGIHELQFIAKDWERKLASGEITGIEAKICKSNIQWVKDAMEKQGIEPIAKSIGDSIERRELERSNALKSWATTKLGEDGEGVEDDARVMLERFMKGLGKRHEPYERPASQFQL